MKDKILKVFLGVLVMSLTNVMYGESTDLSKISIIPKPVKLNFGKGYFKLYGNTNLYVNGDSPKEISEIKRIAEYLKDLLNKSTGFSIKITDNKIENNKGILLSIKKMDKALGREGYKLEVSESKIEITANDPEGIFRGIQTLRQLLPPEIESKEKTKNTKWTIPICSVIDYPRFSWRGMMLDVARHFHSVNDVKRLIDLLVLYKINVLHLHLTDDQGWRIEIKKYPKLTEIGGSRAVGGGKGGFYTQNDYKDIVQYAKDRYMTIVPEVDMPGHCNAALAAYPELNPDNKVKKLRYDIAVGYSTFMCRNEFTYTFIKNVIDEISAITPGKYFHIGGDESKSTLPEDYKYFINRIVKLVNSNEKKVIGWQENIASATSHDSGVIAQYWVGDSPDKRSVIASPASKTYLDMKYNDACPFGLKWAGLITTETGYNWDPDDFTKNADCLGVEAPLWSETIVNLTDIEYMTFPRILGYAEIGWSQKKGRNWDEYKNRLGEQGKRLHTLNVNFYEDPAVPWKN